ncbi:Enhancer of polycomb 1 [Liparis tanakae]|uniref:Enhancer of polycomb 1 n=1 Tax=Liparis tanakae TaxID=230148 RepID=A0A4Z2EHE5_9TELE|nr:Enhancer of polycomb 1 [Liparis tanakae]
MLASPSVSRPTLDTEQPDYDLDSEDETFVNKLKKKMEITALQFEEMIDRLEKGSGQQLVSLQEAKLLLKDDDELIKEVFDYWSRKRKSSKGGCLIPNVKHEKRDGSSTSDPYVAFRRRTEKMQTRKVRVAPGGVPAARPAGGLSFILKSGAVIYI